MWLYKGLRRFQKVNHQGYNYFYMLGSFFLDFAYLNLVKIHEHFVGSEEDLFIWLIIIPNLILPTWTSLKVKGGRCILIYHLGWKLAITWYDPIGT